MDGRWGSGARGTWGDGDAKGAGNQRGQENQSEALILTLRPDRLLKINIANVIAGTRQRRGSSGGTSFYASSAGGGPIVRGALRK